MEPSFDATSWLSDLSANVEKYATLAFPTERLLEVWTSRNSKLVHAVLIPHAHSPCTSFTPLRFVGSS